MNYYPIKYFLNMGAKGLAILLSPIIAACVNKKQEVVGVFKWAVTHDAPLTAWWTCVNASGTKAFMYERQIRIKGQLFLELYFGWKLFRQDPDNRCMIVTRITAKRYPKQKVD